MTKQTVNNVLYELKGERSEVEEKILDPFSSPSVLPICTLTP